MTHDEKRPTALLPVELVFVSGHLSAIGVEVLADGEDALLPREALDHADQCAECGEAIRVRVLQSLALGDELGAAHRAELAELAHRQAALRGARWPLALGIAASIAGVVMASLGSPVTLVDRVLELRRLFDALGHAGRALIFAERPPLVTLSSSVVMVMAALAIMRAKALRDRGDMGTKTRSA